MPDGPYVRNDCGCYEGAEIPVQFNEPLISEVVVWGGDDCPRAIARNAARTRANYQVCGIEFKPGIPSALPAPGVNIAEGDYDTGFIARHAGRR